MMKTITIIVVAITICLGILGTVFAFGGMYQQKLFEDYMKNTQNPPAQEPKFENIPALDLP